MSLKGLPELSTTVPASESITITILGAISSVGVIGIYLTKPIMGVEVKKRRADGQDTATKAKVGTRVQHCLYCLSDVMGTLHKSSMKGFYLVIDNAPIHNPTTIRNLIEARGY
ncbi:hypothetical protein A0J61_01028 [Choanephora cucurbitarum]|uniref:Tc1-like transposase DDE domain-containing protein n=1 Tax=Choanephora cucurbitarum TaxID=101091 RepID=A0A1C7NPJ0_9FUNG|nr:hypothetical protein A0J61_01028 [Choanephora cucurbitarum]